MTLAPEELEARILLEEGGRIAVDKPPDLPTSGRSLDDPDCLQHALIARAGGMVWAVHQLDADTSGVNLFTTERALVEPLKRAMSSADGVKEYLAIVHGAPEWNTRTCEARIGPCEADGVRTLGVSPSGRHASTRFTTLTRSARHALVRARLGTGRTHQIRIHLAHLGHPLVGEEWYRRPPCEIHPRQALHAERLRLGAPFELELRAALPADLVELAGALGLDGDRER